ncbi:MAG: hypothetical protein AUK44_10800 [Porphyromonadaceae bacterium CG2_30_38_12]|nr:MAG: hypothetical protein AUK44_10800 [Porphyromonadaceae bacterium CG2_30_38_12]
MISIIICSRHSDISRDLKENIKSTIGLEYETIIIDNSENKYSIFFAYNFGFSQSNYPYLCFIHEDVIFRTNNWGVKLIEHLQVDKCGVVGIAGGKTVTNIPAQWSNENRFMHIIQHYKKANANSFIQEPLENENLAEEVIVVDGVFLAMQRTLFSHIKFDEQIDGFHSYDYDISIQSVVAGFHNFVVYDVLLEHFSEGFKDKRYYTNLIKVYKKWAAYLPLVTADLSNNTLLHIKEIENRRLKKLIRRMAKTGFSIDEITSTYSFFIDMLNKKGIFFKLRFLKQKIFFIKLYKSILFFKK